jgi:hypothetical protein
MPHLTSLKLRWRYDELTIRRTLDFKWDLAHRRRHDNDTLTAVRYDTDCKPCRLSFSREDIAGMLLVVNTCFVSVESTEPYPCDITLVWCTSGN